MKALQMLAAVTVAAVLVACSDGDARPSLNAPPEQPGFDAARGALLAQQYCAECHGTDLMGRTMDSVTTPSLIGARYYTEAQFETLLTSFTTRDGKLVSEAMWTMPMVVMEDRTLLYEYLVEMVHLR